MIENLDELLLEHAHLERKAASHALHLMSRYPEHAFMQRPLSELVREELSHFEAVLAVLERRGIPFGPQPPSSYASGLLQIVRRREPDKLLDRLLCAAVIEARSCERLKLLAEGLRDSEPELSRFYQGLVRSEARHYALFVDFAEVLFDPTEVDRRLAEICLHEAGILSGDQRSPRMHTGGTDG